MQLRNTILTCLALALISLPAYAGNYSAVEVGTTGEMLKDSALHQNKHYIKDDRALDERVGTVLCDMDDLLTKLHALPPELADNQVVTNAATDDLGYLVGLALNNNPELAPYRSQEAVLAAKTRQAGAMNDPMFSLMFMSFPIPQLPLDDTMMTALSVGVSQKFESNGKRKLRRTIASLEEELKEYSLAQRELDLAGQVRDQYIDMLSTKANQQILDQNIQLMQLLMELAETKYAVGKVPQGQVLSAQVELTKLQEKAINLQNLFKKQRTALLGLLGNPDESVLDGMTFTVTYPEAVSVDVDQDDLLAQALEARPDYQKLELMQSQQQLMVELAKRGYKPDYTISANYGIRWGRRDTISAGIMFPVFTHKEEKQDAKVQETYAMLDVTSDNQAALENMLETRIGVLSVELGRLKDSIDIYKTALVPQARLALDSNIAGFAANKIDLSELFTAQRMLLMYEQDLEQKYIDYIGGLAELQTITAGRFDPMDYLSTPESFVMHESNEQTMQSAAEEEQKEGQQPEEFVPPDQGFISGLKLPEGPAQDSGDDTVQPEKPEDGGDQSSADQEDADQDSAGKDGADKAEDGKEDAGDGTKDPSDGFYQPFKPRSDKS